MYPIVLLHYLRYNSCKGEYPLILHIEVCLSSVTIEKRNVNQKYHYDKVEFNILSC